MLKTKDLRITGFQFSLPITVVCMAIATLMLIAANWQWRRYNEKLELVASFERNYQADATSISSSTLLSADPETLIGRKVTLFGHFDYSKQMIIMNREHATGPGSWLITPFILANSDQAVLVSRGFIPYSDSTPQLLPKYTPNNVPASEEIQGVIQRSVPRRSELSPESFRGFLLTEPNAFDAPPPSGRITNETRGNYQVPKFLYPDLPEMIKMLPYPAVSTLFLQRIGTPISGEFPATSITIDVPPTTHFGYTIEWILLALFTLTVGFLLQAFPQLKNKFLRSRTMNDSANTVMTKPTPRSESGCLHFFALIFALTVAWGNYAYATETPEEVPQNARIEEHLDQQIDLNLRFKNYDGTDVALKDLILPHRPALIVPVYYTCPRLCGLVLDGLTQLLRELDLKLGEDFTVITFSFNPAEGPELAAKRAKERLAIFDGNISRQKGWHFLTGGQENVQALLNQIGFFVKSDGEEFEHSAAIMVLTPEGKLARYHYGMLYPAPNVRLSLIDASRGKIGSTVDKFLLFCFRFDSNHGKYTPNIMLLVRVVSLTVLGFLIFALVKLRKRELKSRQ